MAILECKDLSKRFGSVQALDTVNLKIEAGRVIGLLGPNGISTAVPFLFFLP